MSVLELLQWALIGLGAGSVAVIAFNHSQHIKRHQFLERLDAQLLKRRGLERDAEIDLITRRVMVQMVREERRDRIARPDEVTYAFHCCGGRRGVHAPDCPLATGGAT